MKRILSLLFVMLYVVTAFAQTALAATVFSTSVSSPEYVLAPVTGQTFSPAVYSTAEIVDFNEGANGSYVSEVSIARAQIDVIGANFGYDVGASGELTDYAPYMKMRGTGAINPSDAGYDVDNYVQFYYAGAPLYHTMTSLFEFDLKVDTNTDIVGWRGKALWEGCNYNKYVFQLLSPDGYISGTSYQYPVGKWMHFKMQYDGVADKWNVWVTVDNETTKIVNNLPANASASAFFWYDQSVTSLALFLGQSDGKTEEDEKAGFAIDNLLFGKLVEPSDGYIYSPVSGDEVNDNEALDISANVVGGDSVLFKIDGETLCEIVTPGDGLARAYNASLNLFDHTNGEKELEVYKKTGDVETKLSSVNFTLNRANSNKKMLILNPSITNLAAGQTATVSATVAKRNYYQGDVLAFACLYDELGGLVSVNNIVVAGNSINLNLAIPADYDTDFSVALLTMESPFVVSDSVVLE